MAILSIKNFPDDLYHKLRAPAKRQHRSVTQEVIHLLSELLENPKPLSVLDLKGLGKVHWKGIDPAKHVARERASWDSRTPIHLSEKSATRSSALPRC